MRARSHPPVPINLLVAEREGVVHGHVREAEEDAPAMPCGSGLQVVGVAAATAALVFGTRGLEGAAGSSERAVQALRHRRRRRP